MIGVNNSLGQRGQSRQSGDAQRERTLMRILIISPTLPWPIKSGGDAAQYSTIKCLENDYEFTLLVPIWSTEGAIAAEELRNNLRKVNVKAIECQRPASGRLRRMLSFGKNLLKRTFESQRNSVDIHNPFFQPSSQFLDSIQTEIRNFSPDLIQVEFADLMVLGAWLPREIPKIFIHHQLHFVYSRRYIEVGGSSNRLEFLSAWMAVQEAAYLRCYNVTVVFSGRDKAALGRLVPELSIEVSPFPIPNDVGFISALPSGPSGSFIFVGAQEHGPNRDALNWLINNIWPRIRAACPNSRLIVIGKWHAEWQSSQLGSGIEYKGFVSDLAEAIRGGIMLVPVRIGSGIRTKILLSLAQAVPVISTSVGAEGIAGIPGEHFLVADTEETFAAAAVSVVSNGEIWRNLASKGLSFAKSNYSPEQVGKRRGEIYRSLVVSKN